MCIVLLVSRSTIVELVSLRKSFPCLVLHQTDKTLKAVILSSGRLLHPPSIVLPICLRTARARPTKIFRAVTFLKNVLGFQSTPMSYKLFFLNLDLVSRISEFGPVLFWSGLFL